MLKNAKEMRKKYVERVESTARELIDAIAFLEERDLWETEMDSDNEINLVNQVFGVDEAPCNLEDVYDCMCGVVDKRISEDKSVIEALEEIFTILLSDREDFCLRLLGYDELPITK